MPPVLSLSRSRFPVAEHRGRDKTCKRAKELVRCGERSGSLSLLIPSCPAWLPTFLMSRYFLQVSGGGTVLL